LSTRELDTAWSQIGKRLAAARERSGHTQSSAAAALGLEPVTISRWERGAVKSIKSDNLSKAAALYGTTIDSLLDGLEVLGVEVPRGTTRSDLNRFVHSAEVASVAATLTRAILERLELFKREMIRAGADDAEVDYIEETFRRPETARLAHHDSDGKSLSPKQVEEQYDALIDGVRQIITRRIERRRKAAKAK
jgi:transcriptional regulator with XRE-family HTH domain